MENVISMMDSISELMELGNSIHWEVNLKYPAYKDTKNRSVNIVPMKGLVDVNDTHNIYLHSMMELPIEE